MKKEVIEMSRLPWGKLGLFAGGVLFGTAGIKILSSRDAIAGFIPFCPMICSVYATSQDMTPAYRIGSHA